MSEREPRVRRRELLELAVSSLALASLASCKPEPVRSQPAPLSQPKDKIMSSKMPVLFVGHGSPMNAVLDNTWSRGFAALGSAFPTPKAILAVSAHWYTPGTWLTGNELPKTIHDFGGFPRELYEIQYPASGDSELAKRISGMLAAHSATVRDDWGLDHGTWQVLRHMRPKADVPVVQLSIDHRLPAADHVAIGRALAPLREQGVLIFGSGNIVHNLREFMRSMQSGRAGELPPWAEAFDAHITSALEQHDNAFLAKALDDDTGRMSHPSPDHYLPLLYAAGAASPDDQVSFPITGFDGSISMRAVYWG